MHVTKDGCHDYSISGSYRHCCYFHMGTQSRLLEIGKIQGEGARLANVEMGGNGPLRGAHSRTDGCRWTSLGHVSRSGTKCQEGTGSQTALGGQARA